MIIGQSDFNIKKEIKGELYPCKPDIFAETYEEVTNNENKGDNNE